jgi:hypothetical protein
MVQRHRILSIVLGLAALDALHANANTQVVNGVQWTYLLENEVVVVGGGNGSTAVPSTTSGVINVPSTINGYPVVEINAHAFDNCDALTKVNIPDGVRYIGDSAFANCDGLKEMRIPDSVTYVGTELFDGCTELLSVMFGRNLRSVPAGTFQNCGSLKSVSRLDAVEEIGFRAFYGCGSLETISLPESVKSIATEAFYGCWEGLFDSTSVPGAKLIGGWAVDHAPGLSGHLDLTGVRGIGDCAFRGCANLASVTIPGAARYVGAGAFQDCPALGTVTLGNGIKSILRAAFLNCVSLRGLKIPDGVEFVGRDAFTGCDACLFDAVSNPGVKLMDGWCIGAMDSLSGKVNLCGVRGIAESAFENNAAITDVAIYGSVKHICHEAFRGCASLASLVIPPDVADIKTSAFSGCTGLQRIFFHKDIPLSIQTGGSGNADLFLPATCLVTFYETLFWLDAQGGTVNQPYLILLSNATTGSVAMPTRAGHVFGGYWTGPKGTGTQVFGVDGSMVGRWTGGAAQTLYALWAVPKYRVKYNKNGGTLPKGKKMATQTLTYGKAAKLRKNVFKAPKGKVFAGWAVSKTNAKKGVIAYKNAQKVKNLRTDGKTTTLYAVWAKKTYNVAFYANGGKGKMAAESFTYGKAKALSANKFKAPKGKKFVGWAKSKAAAKKGKVTYKNKAKVKNLVITGKTVKLYAVWGKK